MDIVLIPLFNLVLTVLSLYKWVVIFAVLAGWLVTFGILNTYNSGVSMVMEAFFKLTEPVFGFVRKCVPSLGGLDLSPIIKKLLETENSGTR